MMDIESIGAPAFLVSVLPDGSFRYAGINTANEGATGLSNDLVKGRCPSELHPPHVAGGLIARYRECIQTRALVEYESTAELPRGVIIWRTSLVPTIDASDTVTSLVGICKNVTDARLRQRRIETTNTHLTLALEALNGAHWQMDVQTGEIVASPSLALLMGEPEPRPVPWAEWADRVVQDDCEVAGCDRLIAGSTAQEVVRFRFRGRNGETRWAQCRRSYVRSEQTGQATICGVVVDVTDERVRELQLEAEAYRDPLTNLLNRRGLRRGLDDLLDGLEQAQALGVLVVDLDGFKATNDQYGHAIGDDVLAEVARRMSEALPAAALCARMGGDEFTVVVGRTSAHDMAHHQRTLAAVLREPLVTRGQSVPMGASVGQAFGPVPGRDLEPLLAQADDQLYALKRSRRKGAVLRLVKAG